MSDIDALQREMATAVDHRDVGIFEVGGAPSASPHPDSIRVGLIEAGARRQLADRLKADASMDLAAWCRAAHEAGISISEMSRLSGASRPAIHEWLGQ